MSAIVGGVETNQVTMQNTLEYVIADGKDAVYFTAGKRCVKEESNLDVALAVANLFSQHGRKKHEMVIMDPYEIIVLYILGDCLSEQAIDLSIGVPC